MSEGEIEATDDDASPPALDEAKVLELAACVRRRFTAPEPDAVVRAMVDVRLRSGASSAEIAEAAVMLALGRGTMRKVLDRWNLLASVWDRIQDAEANSDPSSTLR